MVEWRGRRGSRNVIDRRGRRYRGGGGGSAGLALLPVIIRLLGFRGLLIVGVIVAAIFLFGGGGAVQSVLGLLTGGGVRPVAYDGDVPPGTEEAAAMASVILADTEDVWTAVFAENGGRYQEPSLVLFSDAVETDCGFASAAMGPFYCPPDQRVYIDVRFYDELARMGAGDGDFAQAYVLAHEVGHHVQNLLGVLSRADSLQARSGQRDSNAIQVRVELMADCLAGLWTARADRRFGILEDGDIAEGLAAAAAVGDDTIQRRSGGRVVPDSFTHGSAEQRQRWFMRGYETADLASCDTFAAETL
ncbi:neutral zinc metallopeptidase [Hyphobacterium sp. Y6023]|uniref:Neutral zinc metallopeptidase n=1 Tax=Hyphobacterium marinum TaxID=3116574 RepID=A0ABU7LXT9_9PROT|nr:neutral zinc metallopeptidase [Hyphobacterium sp. Y6023]MEE2566368.1 neutral zinc metallopeptidase [Hyphobacterium sp. Y6023]